MLEEERVKGVSQGVVRRWQKMLRSDAVDGGRIV